MSFFNFKKLFRRKEAPPLACHLDLDQDDNHVHTAACFLEVQSLAVAELFQSQSCQSCPPAIPSILDATNNHNLLHLTYDVTFFDHLGWKDTFSNPRWDQRQKNYIRKWGRTSLYTPMVVVNGSADGGSGGGSKAGIDGVVHRARDAGQALGFHIYVDANYETGVRIDTDKQGLGESSASYEVCVVVYEDKTEDIKIKKGPNKGKKVPHKNVVKEIINLGEWKGGDAGYQLPITSVSGTAAAVVVQASGGGPIIATAKVI
ncbi:putative secreted protein [Seiridium cardinale]|uniref:Secreted protein n=1 Tax=Seiridium cardinale TaxID=138064 RepID=A0ABR2XMU8_9PEZI